MSACFSSGWFDGVVKNTEKIQGEQVWHVVFDDGDEQDYNWEELR